MWFSGEGALAEQYLEFGFPVELTVFVNFGHYFSFSIGQDVVAEHY